jgi:hypothetical protein
MRRATLWIVSAMTVAVVTGLVVYQLHIGTKYLPPLSLTGSGASAGGGGKPSMSRIASICKQISQSGSLPSSSGG